MTVKLKFTFLVVVALLGMACATTRSKAFDQKGYHSDLFPYTVHNAAPNVLLGEQWQLENYELSGDGQPIRAKTGAEFVGPLHLDLTGDGVEEQTDAFPLYDLRFRNEQDGGRIWVRSLPYPHQFTRITLRALMRRFIQAMTKDGHEVTRVSGGKPVGIEKRFVTKLIAEGEATVYGHKAYAALVEKIDSSGLDPSEDDSRQLVDIVMVRSKFIWVPRKGKRAFPVLLIACYAGTPEEFPAGRLAFRQFVEQLQIEQSRKMTTTLKAQILNCAKSAKRISFTITKRERYRDIKGGTEQVMAARTSGLQTEERDCLIKVLQEDTETQVGQTYVVRRDEREQRDTGTHLPVLELPTAEPALDRSPTVDVPIDLPFEVTTTPSAPTAESDDSTEWDEADLNEEMEPDEDPEIYEVIEN